MRHKVHRGSCSRQPARLCLTHQCRKEPSPRRLQHHFHTRGSKRKCRVLCEATSASLRSSSEEDPPPGNAFFNWLWNPNPINPRVFNPWAGDKGVCGHPETAEEIISQPVQASAETSQSEERTARSLGILVERDPDSNSADPCADGLLTASHLQRAANDHTCARQLWAQVWKAMAPDLPVDRGKRKQRWRSSQQSQAPEERMAKNERLVSKPVLALQGLAAGPRAQLLALSLLALERQLVSLPPQLIRSATAKDWKCLVPAILASCSLTAAQGLLGYAPHSIQEAASNSRKQLASRRALWEELSREKLLWTSPNQSVVASFMETSTTDVTNNEGERNETQRKRVNRGLAELSDDGPSAVDEKSKLYATVLCHIVDIQEEGSRESCSNHSVQSPAASADREASPRSKFRPEKGEEFWAQLVKFWTSLGRPTRAKQKERPGLKNTQTLPSSLAEPGRGERMRAATERLLIEGTTGVRGWGARGGSTSEAESSGLSQYAALVLEDMAFEIADSVASAYLAEAGAGLSGGPAHAKSLGVKEGSWPTFLHPKLQHTRALERFRNQVAFQQLTERNWDGIVAIYEDKQLLWGSSPSGRLVRRWIPMRRAEELGSLKGLRAGVSLFLETLDFLTPLVQKIGSKAAKAASWLLVFLIGRSLGLVFRGIRQSLGMRRPSKPAQKTDPDTQFV